MKPNKPTNNIFVIGLMIPVFIVVVTIMISLYMLSTEYELRDVCSEICDEMNLTYRGLSKARCVCSKPAVTFYVTPENHSDH